MKNYLLIILALMVQNLSAQNFLSNNNKLNSKIAGKSIMDEVRDFVPDDGAKKIVIHANGNILSQEKSSLYKDGDSFQIFLVQNASDNSQYIVNVDGQYSQTFNVYGLEDSAVKSFNLIEDSDITFRSPVYGPFTDSISIKIFKLEDTKTSEIFSKTYKLLKVYRANLTSGFAFTSLNNPGEIKIGTMANGDSTLIAECDGPRAMITAGVTFYPWGRTYSPADKFKNKLGISINSKLNFEEFTDIFIGPSLDIFNGMTIWAGLHYGKVKYVCGNDDFKFCEEKFSGNLNVSSKWESAFSFGLSMNTGVFRKAFLKE